MTSSRSGPAPPVYGDFIDVLARPSPTYTPRRVALMMAAWLVVLALPLVVWLITR